MEGDTSQCVPSTAVVMLEEDCCNYPIATTSAIIDDDTTTVGIHDPIVLPSSSASTELHHAYVVARLVETEVSPFSQDLARAKNTSVRAKAINPGSHQVCAVVSNHEEPDIVPDNTITPTAITPIATVLDANNATGDLTSSAMIVVRPAVDRERAFTVPPRPSATTNMQNQRQSIGGHQRRWHFLRRRHQQIPHT